MKTVIIDPYALSEALWSAAEFGGNATHALEAAGVIVNPNTGQPFTGEKARVIVPDFPKAKGVQTGGVIIDPSTGRDVNNKEGRPRRPLLISDVPEVVGEIIPNRGEYTRNNDRLEELRRPGLIF